MRIESRDWIILTGLAIVWGSAFLLMKKALIAFEPDQIAALRITISALSLLPLAVHRLQTIKRSDIKYILAFGIFGSGIPAFLFPLAQSRIDSSLAGILNSLTPLFTFLIGVLFFSTYFRWSKVTGVLVGLAGAVFIIFIKSGGAIEIKFNYGFYVVLASLCYGISANILKRHLQDVHPVTIAGGAFLMISPVAVIYLLFSGVEENWNHPEALPSLLYIIILATAGTAYALIFFNKLIQRTNALFASTVTYLIPVIAVLWGVFDGEMLYWQHFAGMLFILGGVYLVSRS